MAKPKCWAVPQAVAPRAPLACASASSGKTRLALEVAARAALDDDGSPVFVELAAEIP